MPLILSIETGTDICSAALARDGKTIALREDGGGRNHAGLLAVYIQELLDELSLSPAELDAVAVGRGPGSYTGLRVGVSLAKGMCYGLNIPLIAVDSLQALAGLALEHPLPADALLCPMIDARRMEVYTRRFDTALNPLSEVEAVILDENTFSDVPADRPVVVFGDGATKVRQAVRRENLVELPVLPSARGMAALAEAAFQRRDFVDTAYFEPLYLKDFIVIPSKKNFLAK